MKTIDKKQLFKGLDENRAEKAWRKMFDGTTKLFPCGITFQSAETADKFVKDFTQKYNKMK